MAESPATPTPPASSGEPLPKIPPAPASGSPSTAPPADPKAGITVEELQTRMEVAQAVQGAAPTQKPFPWPILVTLLVPVAVGVTLALLWQEEMIRSLRVGWIVLWSVLPGFAVMAALGSLAQMRRRPFLSFFAFVLCCGTIAFCWWAVRTITALNLLE